jgi:hypothetical protein
MYVDVCGRMKLRFTETYLVGLSLPYKNMFDDKTNIPTQDHKY